MDDIMVSIICNTYNHEKYIKDALDGFLMQKTNFKYEVLIHDDASTDRTVDIIREYEKKYPDIIKPIYQTENQYSKKNGMIRKLQTERIRGKYTALCEGDDYWTDADKLQRQVDFLENNPEYTLCIHAHNIVNAQTKGIISIYNKNDCDVDLTVKQIIITQGEGMATNSMLFKSDFYINRPKEVLGFPVGDYPLAMFLSFHGKVRCLNQVMSSYRTMSENSWSSKMMGEGDECYKKRIDLLLRMINNLDDLDTYTAKKYHKAFKAKQMSMIKEICELTKKSSQKSLPKEVNSALSFNRKSTYLMFRIKVSIIGRLYRVYKNLKKR